MNRRRRCFTAKYSFAPTVATSRRVPGGVRRGIGVVLLGFSAAASALWLATPEVYGQSGSQEAAATATDGWPVERGDMHGTGVAASDLPARPELLWKRKIGEAIEGTAAVVEGVIYVGDTGGGLHAVRLQDGSPIWSTPFEAGFLAGVGYHQGRVYAGDFNGVLHCVDAKSGAELWKFEANVEFHAGPNFVDDSVLLTSEGGTLYCLDTASGEKRWEFTIDAPLRCMPTISEGRIALAGCDARLHVIDAASGEEVDSVEIDQQTGSTPAAADGHVFFGTEGGTFYNLTTLPAAEVWTYQDPRRRQPIRSAAAVTDELVIYGSNGKSLYALDRQTGEPRWQFPLRTGMENSPVVSGDHVFFASGRGRLYGVSVETGEETWQYNAGGDFLASPAVAAGRLVIGNEDGTLYCFGSSPNK